MTKAKPIASEPSDSIELNLSHQQLALQAPKPPLLREIYGWALTAYLDVFDSDRDTSNSVVAMKIAKWLMATKEPQMRCFLFAAYLAGATDGKQAAELANEINDWATPDDVTANFTTPTGKQKMRNSLALASSDTLSIQEESDHQVARTLRSISQTEPPNDIDTPGLAAMEIFWSAIRGACEKGIGAEHLFVAGVDLGVRLAQDAIMTPQPRERAFRASIEECLSDLRAYGAKQ
jgi:hypothetical protein